MSSSSASTGYETPESWPPADWSLDDAIERSKEERKRRSRPTKRGKSERRSEERDRFFRIDDGTIYCFNDRPSRVVDLLRALVPYQFCYGHKTYDGATPEHPDKPDLGAKEAEIIARFKQTYPEGTESDEYLQGPPLRGPDAGPILFPE